MNDWAGRRVEVCFDYDTSVTEFGVIERHYGDTPTLIRLDSGRRVFGTECQWRLVRQPN